MNTVTGSAQIIAQLMKLKTGLVVIIKVAAHFMEVFENYKMKELCDMLSKHMVTMTSVTK